MGIRTTVTLDDDVLARVRDESRARGTTFKATLNELVREALARKVSMPPSKPFRVIATPFGLKSGFSYDNVEALISYGEGEDHR